MSPPIHGKDLAPPAASITASSLPSDAHDSPIAMKFTVTLAAVVCTVGIAAAQNAYITPTPPRCTADSVRCAGAPEKPYVEYLGCCSKGSRCVVDAAMGWGRFCKAVPADFGKGICTPVNKRCAGAFNHDYVDYYGCCSGECVEDASMGWGKFCKVAPGYTGGKGTTSSPAPPAKTTPMSGERGDYDDAPPSGPTTGSRAPPVKKTPMAGDRDDDDSSTASDPATSSRAPPVTPTTMSGEGGDDGDSPASEPRDEPAAEQSAIPDETSGNDPSTVPDTTDGPVAAPEDSGSGDEGPPESSSPPL
jgi:hypothetical protein